MLSFNEYLTMANDRIAAINYPSTPHNLYEPIAYTMALGGKRIRPILVLMACDALGGNLQEAITPAIGLEMFHNFTLLHDDVMDKADIRRGKPTVHVKWCDNTAILSGDAMLTMATQLIAQSPASSMAKVMELYNTTAMEIYEGQQFDMDFETRSDVTVDGYINMIRLKTSVLLGCACKMGALLAGANDDDATAMYQVGVNLGLAFQLQDDLLDVWGDEKTFGKAIGGDILNNKKTFLLISAQNIATGADKQCLEKWIAATHYDKAEKIAAVKAIYDRLDLRTKSENEIKAYTTKALDSLASLNISAEAKSEFEAFIKKLMNRNK